MKMQKQLFILSVITLLLGIITGIKEINVMACVLSTGSMIIKGVKEETHNGGNEL